MCNSGVQICSVPIQTVHKMIHLALIHRLIMSVAFAAVRGSATIRTSYDALSVPGTSQISGSTTAAFDFPQDRVRILFSEAAFVFHRSSAASMTRVHACYSFLVTVVQPSRITVQMNSALSDRDSVSIRLVGSIDDVLQNSSQSEVGELHGYPK